MKVNVVWHSLHKMPKNASLNERVSWHLAHFKNCSCRTELSSRIINEIEKYRNIDKDFKFNA
jgi:hypothetical protein